MKALIITAEQFEDSELLVPKEALEKVGVRVPVAVPEKGHQVHGKHGAALIADLTLREADPQDYDLLLIPGGKAPMALRRDEHALGIVRRFFKADKPVGAICHGPLVLVGARVVEGRRMTGHPSVARELRDNGARYEDAEVVVDGRLVTSRAPGDLPAFVRELLRQLGKAPV